MPDPPSPLHCDDPDSGRTHAPGRGPGGGLLRLGQLMERDAVGQAGTDAALVQQRRRKLPRPDWAGRGFDQAGRGPDLGGVGDLAVAVVALRICGAERRRGTQAV